MHAIRAVVLASVALVLGACASSAEYRARQDARLATYEKFAREPVKEIRMSPGSITGMPWRRTAWWCSWASIALTC